VELSGEALAAIAASRGAVEALAEDTRPHYGVSTGFGALATRHIAPERRAALQRSLIRSHAAGAGPEVEREVVRAMMLLRMSTLATGHTGVHPDTATAYAALLDEGITPVVHEHGSLGCSGDLAPLAHCALALMGEGEVTDRAGRRRPAAGALRDAGLRPVELREKEGLALINGTDGMLGMLVLAIADLRGLLATADVAAAMSVEGLLGTDRVFAADLQDLPVNGTGEPLYVAVARLAQSWNSGDNIGLVVGATQPAAMARVRQVAPELWFLAPGVGAQGGDLETALMSGRRRDGKGLLFPVSRGISREADPARAAARLRDRIIDIQYQLTKSGH
jgi:hypothetical protein